MKNMTFKDLIAKFKALPVKTRNLIFVILGIAIFLCSYMLGYQKFQEKTAALNEEIGTQSAYVTKLKDYYNNIQTYEKGIADSKQAINENISHLPFDIKSEDFLLYVKTMNEDLNADFKSITFEPDTLIGEFGCTINDKNVNCTAMRSGVSFTSSMTYAQFKDMLQYIYNETNQITFVDTVSLNYDSENARLETNVQLSKFYITYEGAEYVPVPVADIPQGSQDPFNTGA